MEHRYRNVDDDEVFDKEILQYMQHCYNATQSYEYANVCFVINAEHDWVNIGDTAQVHK